jgi:hypothetical protein
MKFASITIVALCLAGCSQEVPNVPAPVAAPTDAPVVAKTDALPADKVTVALSAADCSETPVAVATVGWDAGTLAAGGVAVFVESPGNPRKLWIEAGQKDQATTGKWIFEGTRFTLQDRESGEVLAQRSVNKIPCPPR